jgi:WD40 repeat protein
LLALEGLPDKAAGIKRPYVRETEMALRSAWQNFAEDALLEGHTGTVLDAAYSPNGQRIVTAHRKSNGAVVGCQTAKQIAVLSGHRSAVHSAAYIPNGKRILTAPNNVMYVTLGYVRGLA